MARTRKIVAKPPYDWYLQEWLVACDKKQADLEKDLEWNKSKASLMVNGGQRYHRDDVNEVAEWLHLRPYELLMHPSEAMDLRRLRETAARIAASTDAPRTEPSGNVKSLRTGTNG